MKKFIPTITVLAISFTMIFAGAYVAQGSSSSSSNLNTLAGKNAIVNSTPGLFIQLSGFLQQEANATEPVVTGPNTITPTYIPNSNLDGMTITAPDVTVNVDKAGAPQNEPAIAVDPNNPRRVVVGSNDYVGGTWTCFLGSTPCSAFGDGYSGTFFSNDGGQTWCCTSSDPSHLGTLIPGVEHLTGGQYDAGGDPSLAFNTEGAVYYSGLGFDRTAAPNTVTVSKGTFDGSGMLHWGQPTFIGQTTSPSTLNDKEWIAIDTHASSHFLNRVYVSWTRFIFSAQKGTYIQSPIFFTFSSDGGATFSNPQLIGGPVIFDQGSHVVVGPDGTVYVFWEGSTKLATFNSIWLVKSTDGGVTFSDPVAVAQDVDILRPFNTRFRVNSFPMADVAPDGTIFTAWSSEIPNSAPSYTIDPNCAYFIVGTAKVYANCHSASWYSKSTDGGATWTTPLLIFPAADASSRTPIGYPQTQPDGTILNAPPARRVDTFFPSVAITPSGNVYMSAYAADIVSPWKACITFQSSVNCAKPDSYINNARLDYLLTDLTTGVTKTLTTQPINSRYQFREGFFGDYTSIATGSDNTVHAVWTDSNNVQTIVWWFGTQYTPFQIHQQDIATTAANF
jgi:hypothetical protein